MSTAPDLSSETLIVRGEASESAVVPRFWLLVVAGPDTGATLTSGGDRTVIGTYDSCDLILRDSTVSRFHCEIDMARGRPVIRDLGSLNGTTVNGVAVAAAGLRSGSTIGVGRTQLRFDVGSEAVKLALSQRTRFGGLVGRSIAMRRTFELLERAAAGDQPVVIEGEPGTGKRTAAAGIHAESARRDRPYVLLDCSAAPGDRVEAELFGRRGAFEAAQGGTLVLAEVAALPPELQQRLLRLLERKDAGVPDVRIVVTTHRNLRAEVNGKRFRADLTYRLAGLEVRMPPLRERTDDVPLLVADLAERWVGKERAQAAAAHLGGIGRGPLPGNTAELEAAVARALDGGGAASPLPLVVARDAFVRAEERRWAAALLARHGDEEVAARAGGIDVLTLRRLLAAR